MDMMHAAHAANRAGPVILVSKEISFALPLSYAYLAGYLRAEGEDVRVFFRPSVVAFRSEYYADLVKQIMDADPILVGFGSLYPELQEIGRLIALLDKAGRRFPVVVGGQMVSPTPAFAVEVTGADYGVVGEGEITLYRLVKCLREGGDPLSVTGLAVRQGDAVVLTGPGEYIVDLSELPPVPYDLFPVEKWLRIGRWYVENRPQPHWRFNDRVINVHGGRGCPFTCNFCYHASRPRYRPLSLMMEEAATAMKRFDANVLYFSDDLVLATPHRAAQLVDEIRKLDRRIEYSVSTRFDLLTRLDDDLLAEMKKTGCRIMGLGIESGSDRILKHIGKNCTAAIIFEGLERLKKAGILPSVSVMVGQHTETMEDAEASRALVLRAVRSNPNMVCAFTVTTPFPGSQLYRLIFQEGRLKDDREFYDRYFAAISKPPYEWNQIVNLSAMTEEQVLEMRDRMHREFLVEKEKGLSPSVKRLSNIHVKMAGRYHDLRPWFAPKCEKRVLLRWILTTYDGCYSLLQVGLERIRLWASGIG